MIPTETNVGAEYSNDAAANDIGAKVTKLRVACGTDPGCDAYGEYGNDKCPCRRCRGLIADRNDPFVRIGAAMCRFPFTRSIGRLVFRVEEWKNRRLLWFERCVRGLCRVRPWREKWNRDGKFGAQKQGEVEEASPGEGRVAAGKAFEASVNNVRIGLGADSRVN